MWCVLVIKVDEVVMILSRLLWILCAGNCEDDSDVENDGFQIPDAVFGTAGCHTAGVVVNGERIISWFQ